MAGRVSKNAREGKPTKALKALCPRGHTIQRVMVQTRSRFSYACFLEDGRLYAPEVCEPWDEQGERT